jgi:hypothetical protein
MLRARTIRRAVCALTFALAALASQPAFAGGNVQGTSCTAGGVSAGIGTGADSDGNNLVCVGGTWQYPTYVMQSAAAAAQSSCSGYPAGAMRWNTTISNLEVCDGTTWQAIGNTASACGSPSGLSFNDVTNASLGTIYTSNTATITFSGCSSALSVSVTGASTAQISINGGGWTTSGSIYSGQTLQVRLTASSSADTELTATVTVGGSSVDWTVTTGTGGSMIFTTPTQYLGYTIGGLSGADADCQAAATAASLSGTWKAVMSDDTTSAASRLTINYPVVNAFAASPGYGGGTIVAATNLWGGSISNCINNPSGTCHDSGGGGAPVWTGTNADGSIDTGYTCGSWSNSSDSGAVGYTNNPGGGAWVGYTNLGCTGDYYLYCIQQ